MLLSYESALSSVLAKGASRLESERVALGSCPGRVLAEPLVASTPNPSFTNSAVDGYGLHAADLNRPGELLKVVGAIAAGDRADGVLEAGMAVRILTGAPIPVGVASVVMQEDVERIHGGIRFFARVREGANIREAGTDFAVGEPLLAAGDVLNPGAIGLLASQGETSPAVYRRPRVTILTTGDELVSPETTPLPHQLRDSNGVSLTAAVAPLGEANSRHVADDYEALRDALQAAASESDLVLVAGGASVGDKDFVAAVLAEIGTVQFHGVSIRPGKPVLFGYCGEVPVLGLPGNPASALVTFTLFGLPLLHQIAGIRVVESKWVPLPFLGTHDPEKREVFSRIVVVEGGVAPVYEQGSFGLRSMQAADGLARLSAGRPVAHSELVPVLLF